MRVVLVLLALGACGHKTSGSATDEVARLVVDDLHSNAFGNQTISASCVEVSIVPTTNGTVAAARLDGCGDPATLWVFKRAGNAPWSEEFLGVAPTCWDGVPPDIADAVSRATRIPRC